MLASSTHKSAQKPADLKITTKNYEGKDIQYNHAWRKLQEANDMQTTAAAESFDLLILFLLFLKEWKDVNLRFTMDWWVDEETQICLSLLY